MAPRGNHDDPDNQPEQPGKRRPDDMPCRRIGTHNEKINKLRPAYSSVDQG
jgi:hypothetical protein